MSDFWHTFFIVGGREQEICYCGVGKICRMQIGRRSLVFGLSVVLIERCVEWSWLRSRSVRTNYEVQEARYELLVRQKEFTSLVSQYYNKNYLLYYYLQIKRPKIKRLIKE